MDRSAYFDTPWGARRPRGVRAALIQLGHRLPPTWLGARLGFLVRRLARARLGGPVDVELWGVRFRLFPRGNITEGRLLFMPRQWDPAEREAIRSHARPGAVFVDVGSNVGAYSWWVRSLLGDACRILALEPDPELKAGLVWHVEQNGAAGFEVDGTAAGREEGEAILRIHRANRGQNTLAGTERFEDDAVETKHTVRVAPLSRILQEHGIDHVDILKIDIEGLEWDVLSTFFDQAPPSLWPRLLITEHSESDSHQRLAALLEERGFGVLSRTRMNLILEYDGKRS